MPEKNWKKRKKNSRCRRRCFGRFARKRIRRSASAGRYFLMTIKWCLFLFKALFIDNYCGLPYNYLVKIYKTNEKDKCYFKYAFIS